MVRNRHFCIFLCRKTETTTTKSHAVVRLPWQQELWKRNRKVLTVCYPSICKKHSFRESGEWVRTVANPFSSSKGSQFHGYRIHMCKLVTFLWESAVCAQKTHSKCSAYTRLLNKRCKRFTGEKCFLAHIKERNKSCFFGPTFTFFSHRCQKLEPLQCA